MIILRYKFDQEEFDSGSAIWPCCKACCCGPCSAAQMGVHYEQVKFRDYINQAKMGKEQIPNSFTDSLLRQNSMKHV